MIPWPYVVYWIVAGLYTFRKAPSQYQDGGMLVFAMAFGGFIFPLLVLERILG